MAPNARLSRKELVTYGLLAAPLAFAGMPLYVHAPDFYTARLGVPLSSIGIVLLLLRCVDAVQDPLIGRLSDTYFRHRHTIITSACGLLVISFFLLFNPLSSHLLLWFALAMLCATTSFSIISINLNTLGGLWTKDPFQKTRITSYREAFGLLGLLLAVILPSVFMQQMEAKAAFLWVSVILASVMLVALYAFVSWTRSHPFAALPDAQHGSFMHTFSSLPARTRRFFAIYTVSMLASSIPALLVLFFIRDRLGAEAYTGVFLLLYFLAGALGMPIWQQLSRHWGKYNAWAIAMLLAVANFFWAFFLENGDVWQYATICVLSGISFGADLALPPSILADDIHHHNTEHTASMQFGIFAFLAKASLALASFVGLSLLDMVGFRPAQANHDNALLTLSFLYALLPCVIKLIAVLVLWKSSPLFNHGHS